MAETYKWVDEQGVVTFSQNPPPDGQAEKVDLRTATPPSDSQKSQKQVDQLRQRLADSEEDRELAKQEQEKTEEEAKIKRKNCQAARSNLQKLEGLGNRLYKTEGEYRRLGDEERQSLMQKERENIKANCEG
jgi:chromosome segregation ATPase